MGRRHVVHAQLQTARSDLGRQLPDRAHRGVVPFNAWDVPARRRRAGVEFDAQVGMRRRGSRVHGLDDRATLHVDFHRVRSAKGHVIVAQLGLGDFGLDSLERNLGVLLVQLRHRHRGTLPVAVEPVVLMHPPEPARMVCRQLVQARFRPHLALVRHRELVGHSIVELHHQARDVARLLEPHFVWRRVRQRKRTDVERCHGVVSAAVLSHCGNRGQAHHGQYKLLYLYTCHFAASFHSFPALPNGPSQTT